MTFESIFRNAVCEYQPKMEELVGVSFGEIQIDSLGSVVQTAKNNWHNNLHLLKTLLGAKGSLYLGHAGRITINGRVRPLIMYNPCIVLGLLPTNFIQYIAAHELGHVAHAKKVGDYVMENMICPPLTEIMADYLAVCVTGRMNVGFKPFNQVVASNYSYVNRGLDKLGQRIEDALPAFGFDEAWR